MHFYFDRQHTTHHIRIVMQSNSTPTGAGNTAAHNMKTKLARGIARNLRDIAEASAAILHIDASDERYLNHVMEARSRYVETVDKAELSIANLLIALTN
jgi:hypothetical protein